MNLHDRMRRAVVAVHVELFFEERVHGRVEVEREPGRAARAELVVYVEATRALDEEPRRLRSAAFVEFGVR